MPNWALPVLICKDNIKNLSRCYGTIRSRESGQVRPAPFYNHMITTAADSTAGL